MPESVVEIGHLWRHINGEIRALFREAMSESQLPVMAAYLLRHIHKHPGVSVSELSRRSHTAKSHVSNILDQLVAEDYIEKRTDEADQRIVRLFVTDAAVAEFKQAETRSGALWLRVMQEIPEDEREDVIRLLRTLLHALRTVNGSAGEGENCGTGVVNE